MIQLQSLQLACFLLAESPQFQGKYDLEISARVYLIVTNSSFRPWTTAEPESQSVSRGS